MEQIAMNDLNALVAKGQELKAILTETPEILSFLRLIKDLGDGKAVLPAQTDALVFAGQAAKVLGVDKATIYRYVKDGILKPYYTPYCSYIEGD